MDQLKKAESHSLKRNFDNISSVPDTEEVEKPFIKNPMKTENLNSTEDRITLSFNSFQKHLNAMKTPQQAQTNSQNNSNIPNSQGQIEEEGIMPASGPIEGSFARPPPKKLDPAKLTNMSNGQANPSLNSEENKNTTNEGFSGTRYEYHQINNTSFHTASMVKFSMGAGGTAFQSRKTVNNKMLPKESESKPEEMESIVVKDSSDKPAQVDEALLKRFMRMFEE